MKKEKNDNDMIKIALIATYPHMSKILSDLVAEEQGVCLYDVYASFEEAVEKAKSMEGELDAILSRGATAEHIKRAVSIPVISIPISPFDLTHSIYTLKLEGKKFKEIAFFNCARNIFGIREIEDLFGIKIYEYTFMSLSDIENNVKDCVHKGINIIVGGAVAERLSRKYAITGVEVSSGKETIYSALKETIQLCKVRREEKKKAVRLEVVFDSLSEGIIVTDNQNNVLVCNTAAKRIINPYVYGSGFGHLPSSRCPKSCASTICSDLLTANKDETEKEAMGLIRKINNTMVNINKYPVISDGKEIGVVTTIQDITRVINLETQIRNKLYAKGFVAKYTFDDIITSVRNQKMNNIKNMARLYAGTDSSILIAGETGTGKELFAQSIHNASKYANGPFVAVNCSAIPENLIESELFGYEAGAFTGAKKEGKKGYFELAHNGTIFLDEIGDIPLSFQARLLRAIQEKEIVRIGGDKVLPINVRIISATNKDLEKKVIKGEFREDLFYRLNIFKISIPPLRQRKEDIELLINSIIEKRYRLSEKDRKMLDKLMPELIEYDWPGNVRQLYNIIERISIVFNSTWEDTIREKMLKEILEFNTGIDIENNSHDEERINLNISVRNGLKDALTEAEKQIIKFIIRKCGNNISEAQRELGVSRTTLWRKINT